MYLIVKTIPCPDSCVQTCPQGNSKNPELEQNARQPCESMRVAPCGDKVMVPAKGLGQELLSKVTSVLSDVTWSLTLFK